MDAIEFERQANSMFAADLDRLIATVFRGDHAAWQLSLPERRTLEGPGGWYTEPR